MKLLQKFVWVCMAAMVLMLCIGIGRGQGAYPMPSPEVQYLDANGQPLAGAKVCTYLGNTSTPELTYTDSTGTTLNTNPIILDSAGRASIWLGPVSYKIVVLTGGDGTCATGTTVWTQNNVAAAFSVGGTQGWVQFSNGGGAFNGSPNFFWNNSTQTLTIFGEGASSAGLIVNNGFILSGGGFDASNVAIPTMPLPFNTIQAPFGGMFAKSFTAQTYIQVGQSAGPFSTNPPPLTINDSFHAGAIAYDQASTCFSGYNGSTWTCLGSGGGGGGSPGGVINSIQINNGVGGFGGNAGLVYASGNVTLTGATSSFLTAGTSAGFDATTCTATNCIQAPLGGILGLTLRTTDSAIWVEEAAPPLSAANQARVYADSAHTLMLSENAGAYFPFAISSGILMNGHCVSISVSAGITSLVDAGGACTTGGGGGTVSASAQFNVGFYTSAGTSTTIGGNSDFTYNSSTQLLTVTGVSGNASIAANGNSFFQANGTTNGGFLAPTTVNWNTFYAPDGGMGGLSFTAVNYIQPGSYSTTLASGPPITTNDTFHAGAISYYSGSVGGPCPVFYNGSSWVCFSGGGGAPGGSTGNLQFNSGGVFGGNGNLTWNNASQQLTLTTTGGAAGLDVIGGFIQSDLGFLANGATAYNAIQAPSGGGAARSFTATTYIQSGNAGGVPSPTTSDSFHAGALFYNTALTCEQVYSGSAWSCLGGGSSGVSSLNSLFGALSITSGSTPNEITVSPSGTTIALTLPQAIGTTSNVSFNQITATGEFISNVTGASIGFGTNNGCGSLNGNGVLQLGCSASGVNVTADTASNSIQTVGGTFSSLGYNTGPVGVYDINGTTIINNAGQFVGAAVLATGNVEVGVAGVFAVAGGFFGETHNAVIGSCTLSFKGGILYATSGC